MNTNINNNNPLEERILVRPASGLVRLISVSIRIQASCIQIYLSRHVPSVSNICYNKRYSPSAANNIIE